MNASANFSLPPELVESIASAESRIASTTLLSERLRGFVASVDDARKARNAAVDERTARDTELALATDEKTAKTLESRVTKASAAVDEAQQVLDRRERVLGALKGERDKAAEALRAEVDGLELGIQGFCGYLYELVDREIREASPKLIAALRMAWVLELATQRAWMRHALDAINIQVPGPGGPLIVGERVHVDKKSTSVYAGWAEEPDLAEVHRLARSPIEMLRKLKACADGVQREINPPPSGRVASRQQTPEEAAAEEEAARRESAAIHARRAAEPHVVRGRTLQPGAIA